MNPIAIALSGLTASTARLTVSASNIANAQTPGYQPRGVTASPLPGGGVTTQVVALPDTDLATEIVGQIAATHAYKANLETIRTAEEMTSALLDIV